MATPNFANRTLYHGNNLDFLRGMDSGTIQLIATDPPFNKSKDFHATPDSLASGASFQDRWSWRDDIHDDWLIAIQRDEPEVWQVINTAKAVYGDDMGAFLCWLGVRLLEMHRILADDGSLYLHIDHTAHAWTKCLLDAIFGRENFQNEIVWHYRRWTGGANRFQQLHDTILFYSKSSKPVFNVQYDDYTEKSLKRKQNYHTRIKNGDVYVTSIDERGVRAGDVWQIPVLNSQSKERTGYPTQKPLALYERIIEASSNPGDVVLDPFCGCATTPIAAERLGRQWVGMGHMGGGGGPSAAAHGVQQATADGRRSAGDVHDDAAPAHGHGRDCRVGAADAARPSAALPASTEPARATTPRHRAVLPRLRRGLRL